MAKQSWSDIGNSISDAVQDAIDTEDFSKLSQSIQNIVSTAVSTAGESLTRAADSVRRRQAAVSEAQNPWKGNGQFEKKTVRYMTAKDIPDNELYTTGGATRVGGYVLIVIGGWMTLLLAVGFFTAVIMKERLLMLVMLLFLAASIFFLYKGVSMLGRIRRFKNYVRALGTRKCISVAELAASVGKSEGAALKDIRRMLNRGMFRQGHLDINGKNLFVTNQGYEAYLGDQQRMQEEKAAKLAREKEETAYKNNDRLSDEVKNLIAEGRGYIDKIHMANEAIKDETISQKLDGLETVTAKIFQYVEQNPESAADTKKLMKYYLPTTIRLLESYQNLSDHPVQGANITKSQKEIEDTLDTLNQAFAKLFDNLYQDTSMDITSDISVLNTLLAQEGLTGKDIKEQKQTPTKQVLM